MFTSILVSLIIIILSGIAIYFLGSENSKSIATKQVKSDDTAVAAIPLTQDVDSSSLF